MTSRLLSHPIKPLSETCFRPVGKRRYCCVNLPPWTVEIATELCICRIVKLGPFTTHCRWRFCTSSFPNKQEDSKNGCPMAIQEELSIGLFPPPPQNPMILRTISPPSFSLSHTPRFILFCVDSIFALREIYKDALYLVIKNEQMKKSVSSQLT